MPEDIDDWDDEEKAAVSAFLEARFREAENGPFLTLAEVDESLAEQKKKWLAERKAARATKVAEFNDELVRRIATLERGETVDPQEALDQLRRKSQRGRPSATSS